MDELDKAGLIAELVNQQCSLQHKDQGDHPAVEYIVCPMGMKQSDIVSEVQAYHTIPICKECAESLQNDEWVLIYCYKCNESQWVYKPLSRIRYKVDQHIIWIEGCPKCSEKTRRVIHNDKW